MRTEPRVSAVAATGVVRLISQYGGDADRVFGAAQVNMDAAADPVALLDLRRYCTLFEQAARQTGLGSFGLRFGAQYQLEDMGPLGLLIVNSATLGEALNRLCTYFPAMQEHTTLRLRLEPSTDVLCALEYGIRDGRIAERRQDAELTLSIFMRIFTRCLGPSFAPEEVHFEHLRGAEANDFRTCFGAPVYFSAPINAIVFRRQALNAAMPGADFSKLAALHAELRNRSAAARPDDFIGRLAHEIRAGLAAGDVSMENISAALGFSRAGLYRRLAGEGVDFSALTQNIRHDLAVFYVTQPGIPFTDIAFLLGYSELSAFSRAFLRWTGRSPARYRRESHGQGATL
ncbi:MAG: AraC family transcriptional regulator [Acidocella sp.]|nr:AraC family transcriptional regulator [Acidocella sp.]